MRMPTGAAIRDAILLVAGLALLGHETLVAVEPRIVLVTIAAAMLGLPIPLRIDGQRARSRKGHLPDQVPPP